MSGINYISTATSPQGQAQYAQELLAMTSDKEAIGQTVQSFEESMASFSEKILKVLQKRGKIP